MNLKDGREFAISLMCRHHLFPTWDLKFTDIYEHTDPDDKDWCAYYNPENPTDLYIGVMPSFVEKNTKKTIKEVILHECAHCLDYQIRGYSNHDAFWKRICEQIGCSGATRIEGVK
jgi:hypothetical protein